MSFHIRWTSNVNPPHYGRWCWDCLIDVRCSTTSFRSDSNQNYCFAMQSKTSTMLAPAGPWYSQCAMCIAPSCMNIAGPATSGWLSRCGTAWVSRTWLKFHQAVVIDLDLGQWQFAIMGKEPKYHDGSVSVGISSLDTARMERLKLRDVLWRPQGSPYRAYLARMPLTVLSGISKIRPMAAAFIPVTEVPTTRHRWALLVIHIMAVWRKYYSDHWWLQANL